MADGHGGYRKPSNPAPVSGPGALSRRTDGHPSQVPSAAPDQGYGEKKQQMSDQRIAPMAGKQPLPSVPNVPASAPDAQGGAPYSGGPFTAPSSRPNEPVTSGAAIGPGAGPAFTPNYAAQPTGAMTNMLYQLSATDTTGVLAQLYQTAKDRGV